MAGFRVVLDACVLVPIVKADLLLTFAANGAFVPLWSERILAETEAAIIKVTNGAVLRDAANRRTQAMQSAFDDALVTDWEPLVECLDGMPDRNDRHVLAAAVQGNAAAIVTDNIDDFPDDILQKWGVHARTSDDFLLDLLDLHRGRGIASLIELSERRRNSPTTVDEVLYRLERSGVPGFARRARELLES